MTEGRVREWDDEQGFGVIDSDDTPGGCGAVFAVIQAEGYRTLRPGQLVRFRFIAAPQDDRNFRAVEVIPADT
jgi:cold shock protein